MNWLTRLKQKLKDWQSTQPPFDPSTLNDPLALEVAWGPANPGGANFATHKLVQRAPGVLAFRVSHFATFFCGIFVVIGLGVAIGTGLENLQGEQTHPVAMVMGPLMGLVFISVGLLFRYFWGKPRVFDRSAGIYYKGYRKPNLLAPRGQKKPAFVYLDEIHALQIVSEVVRGDKSTYTSYELNLVLKDATRVNVVDHGNKKVLREDAERLAQALGKVIWDAG